MNGATGASTPIKRDWSDVRRLVVIRLDNLGDVLMTTPALTAVRQAHPDAHITLLTSPSGAALAGHLDMVDDILPLAVPWMKGAPGRAPLMASDGDGVAVLRQGAYDAAIVFTTASQSPLPMALLCWQAGIPRCLAHCRENPYDLLSDWVPDSEVVQDGMRHEVQRQLDLVAARGMAPAAPGLVFELKAADHAGARAYLRHLGLPAGQAFVLLHPGATAPSRRYPPALFGQAMGQLARQGLHCVFVGAGEDAELAREAHAAAGAQGWLLTDRLTLGEFGALIQQAAVLVCNNSGPAHLAAAVGTPVVDLYAQTNPQHTPWQVPARVLFHDVPCRNCLRSVCPQGHHACLRGVPPEAVAEAAIDLLAATDERSRHGA